MAISDHADTRGGTEDSPLTDKGRELHRLFLQEIARLAAGRLYKAVKEVKKRNPLVAEVLEETASELDGAAPDWLVPALEEEVKEKAKPPTPGLIDGVSELEAVRSLIPSLPSRAVTILAKFAGERDKINRMADEIDSFKEAGDEESASVTLEQLIRAEGDLYSSALRAIVSRGGDAVAIAGAALGQEVGA